jgi:hypothetical protein
MAIAADAIVRSSMGGEQLAELVSFTTLASQ